MRLEGDHVVVGQILQAVRQLSGKPTLAFANDDDVEELLLEGQVFLQLDDERRASEEIGEQ